MSDQARRARPISLWIVVIAAVGGVVVLQLYRTFIQLSAFRAFAVVFVSLSAEALPFLVLGAYFSAAVERYRPAGWPPVLTPIMNPVMVLATFAAFRSRLGMAGARFLLMAICAVPLVLWSRRLHTRGRQAVTDNAPAGFGDKALALTQAASDHFLVLIRPFVIAALAMALIQIAVPPEWATALRARPLVAIGAAIVLSFLLSVGPESDAFIARSLPGFLPPAAVIAYLVASPWLRLTTVGETHRALGRAAAPLLAAVAVLSFLAAAALHAFWTGGWW